MKSIKEFLNIIFPLPHHLCSEKSIKTRLEIMQTIRKQEPNCRKNMLTMQFLRIDYLDHYKQVSRRKDPMEIYPQTIRELMLNEKETN